MRCLLLFRDDLGHLPTAQELLQYGFHVSEAVLREREVEAERPRLARAAEPPAPYGISRNGAAPGQEGGEDQRD